MHLVVSSTYLLLRVLSLSMPEIVLTRCCLLMDCVWWLRHIQNRPDAVWSPCRRFGIHCPLWTFSCHRLASSSPHWICSPCPCTYPTASLPCFRLAPRPRLLRRLRLGRTLLRRPSTPLLVHSGYMQFASPVPSPLSGLFAGARASLSSVVAALDLDCFPPLDLIIDALRDILEDDIFAKLRRIADAGLVGAALAAPVCSKHSILRLRPGGPRPLLSFHRVVRALTGARRVSCRTVHYCMIALGSCSQESVPQAALSLWRIPLLPSRFMTR